jgi:hypothetical protein
MAVHLKLLSKTVVVASFVVVVSCDLGDLLFGSRTQSRAGTDCVHFNACKKTGLFQPS